MSPESTGQVHATRRAGARHELSARVTLKPRKGQALEGWALNQSKGGVRVIVEENVPLGAEFEVVLEEGGGTSPPQWGRVVWVQEEPDGVIAGIEYFDEPSMRKGGSPDHE